MPTTDRDRYDSERSFHDRRFEHETRTRTDKFYAVDAGSAHYDRLLSAVGTGDRVLEYGCGAGSAAFDLAARGAEVLGIDISPVGVAAAADEAAGRGSSAAFAEMNAEALDLPDASFDVVCGSGILHHLDLERATGEIARVLRPGGWAVFLEPLGMNPIINLYRQRTPELRTPDEHPLVTADFELFRRVFDDVRTDDFNLLSIAAAPLARRRLGPGLVGWLQRRDASLLARVPSLRRFAWVTVVRFARPSEAVR